MASEMDHELFLYEWLRVAVDKAAPPYEQAQELLDFAEKLERRRRKRQRSPRAKAVQPTEDATASESRNRLRRQLIVARLIVLLARAADDLPLGQVDWLATDVTTALERARGLPAPGME